MDDLLERVESTDVKSLHRLSDDIYEAVFPEPDRGPWYWRNSAWQKWGHVAFTIRHAMKDGRWRYVLNWLYRDQMPELIHSDPKKAILTALRASMTSTNAGEN